MENQKSVYSNTSIPPNTNNDIIFNETVHKHTHQQNTTPQHLRLLQWDCKLPNHQYLTTSSSPMPGVHRSQPSHESNPPYHLYHTNQSQNQRQFSQFLPQYNIKCVPTHSHNINQLSQSTPQSWVPFQLPGHYHSQQQQQPQSQSQSQPTVNENQSILPSPDAAQQPKSRDSNEKKKTVGNVTQHKSPSAKRPIEAPVTIQGWLHKQGSDGLMLWKKRWFVLSEFCLYYYKGPEEEKLLGSILLPSYKVSICNLEDKINRRCAFKCEHANMRTYILAADSLELTFEWVRALDMASQLQSPLDEQNSGKCSTSTNIIDNYNSVPQSIHTLTVRNTPVHMYSSSNTTEFSNSSQQELSRYSQHLYANAPPKPRRLTDGYVSSSPDIIDRYSGDTKYVTLQPFQSYSPPEYIVRNNAKSPINIYGNPQLHPEYFKQNVHHQFCNLQITKDNNNLQNAERRTPDTYGRSLLNAAINKHPSDYEDIYGDHAMYKRPLSPISSYSSSRPGPSQTKVNQEIYSHVKMRSPRESYVQYQRLANTIPRPHSADFLEYQVKHHDLNIMTREQSRPKSSLDMNITKQGSGDNYFYSEESYAEKMRNSVQYLQKMPTTTTEYPKRSNVKPDTTTNYSLMRSTIKPTKFKDISQKDSVPLRSRNFFSIESVSKELDNEFDMNITSNYNKGSISPISRDRLEDTYECSEDARRFVRDYDNHFTRSPNARLAHQGILQMEEKLTTKESERKREESMKRLLEWKQRMLQSPLNRKVCQGITNSSAINGKSNYSRNNEGDYMHPASGEGYDESGCTSGVYHPQYNSYSSDDEEKVEGSKENVQTQAGCTTKTNQSTSESNISAPVNFATEFTSSQTISTCTDTLSRTFNTNNCLITATTRTDLSEGFVNPLKNINKQSAHEGFVSNLKSEVLNKFETTPSCIATESNDALVKNILTKFDTQTHEGTQKIVNQNRTDPQVLTVESSPEENYMTMTSNKSVFESHDHLLDFNLKSEQTDNSESPYVEMTQNAQTSLLKSETNSSEFEPYETVCFSEGIIEPVYVELQNPSYSIKLNEQPPTTNKSDLPDILINSKNKSNEADSSDADDEASRDLDSLDIHCHSRFNLSDTFRPASYYLGVTRIAPEQLDSSDSELVSPPPMDEFEYIDTSLTSALHDDSKVKDNTKMRNSDSSLYNLDGDNRSTQNIDSNVGYEKILKRRPVSENFYGELGCLDLKMNTCSDESVPPFHDYENLYMLYSDKTETTSTVMSSPVSTVDCVNSRENSRDTRTSQQDLNSGSQHSIESCTDYLLRARPECNNSLSTELTAFLGTSSPYLTPITRPGSSLRVEELTPSSVYFSSNKLEYNISGTQPAPYYYSDLSINTSRTESTSSVLTLNNQREMGGSKRDIAHIVNPIRCNNRIRNAHAPYHGYFGNRCTLAAEARSASVDFLNIADKSGNIDKKNIYESDTLKRLKRMVVKPERNFFPSILKDKFGIDDDDCGVRRSYSLEGLLDNVLQHNGTTVDFHDTGENNRVDEGSHLWEEDSLWRERLRSASQRHTRSLDDLDCMENVQKKAKKQARRISRMVTYVNDSMFNMPLQDKQCSQSANIDDSPDSGEEKKRSSFAIDRENLRQWDFLSSAPSDTQLIGNKFAQGNNLVVDLGSGISASESSEQSNVEYPASGSLSINTRGTFPRITFDKKATAGSRSPFKSITNISRTSENDYAISRKPQHGIYASQEHCQNDVNLDISQSYLRQTNWQLEKTMNFSAGELLGRTHEELVLLLIQLRRQNANTSNAIEACYNEIDSIQSNIPKMDAAKRLENLQKLEQIKQNLLELEKQYEKGKPLVNLVDNMVKLGSLYRFPKERNNMPHVLDRLEFNQQLQERRFLAEERRDWNRLHPNNSQLQVKVQQLYQLDQLIHEESESLQNLQHDKEEIERALGELRVKFNKGLNNPNEIEHARKQQICLENELSRVHSMLAQNSRKLEETVAGNARLEQELLILKQKLQISRQQRSSPQISNAGDSLPCVIGTSAMLESDLQSVQQKVGDLHRQRQELSIQVRHLTDRSNCSQWRQSSNVDYQQVAANKKKINSLWRETDLDTMNSVDHGEFWESLPLYINTDLKQRDLDIYNSGMKRSDNSEESSNQLASQEKQEIKTVRIVKRESERRQRDRERTVTGKGDLTIEEDDSTLLSTELSSKQSFIENIPNRTLEHMSPIISKLDTNKSGSMVLSRPSLPHYSDVSSTSSKSSGLSPTFKSEAARQIIIEMSAQDNIKPINSNRRAVPKEKRRHYTAPYNNLMMKSANQLPIDDNDFDKVDLNSRRARDDIDMERALRQRIDAPDVVRSTLSNKELKYNEHTIDSLLGTPNKIIIPERYVPEQLPQLSAEEQQHRLRKVESIKKMLSDSTIISGNTPNLMTEDVNTEAASTSVTNKATSKMIEEKRQREHLLQLNQILAIQVMEMSKIVAVKALAALPLETNKMNLNEGDPPSPNSPLPIYQKRDNFYS